ncbi:MAG: hypothetical protein KA998_02765 [Rickettsiaceae bacterium]|nr:hypothetical protein [Rickettsiaceae bacterium]
MTPEQYKETLENAQIDVWEYESKQAQGGKKLPNYPLPFNKNEVLMGALLKKELADMEKEQAANKSGLFSNILSSFKKDKKDKKENRGPSL